MEWGRTEVDGVPTFWSRRDGELKAGLVFRVGHADEHWRGAACTSDCGWPRASATVRSPPMTGATGRWPRSRRSWTDWRPCTPGWSTASSTQSTGWLRNRRPRGKSRRSSTRSERRSRNPAPPPDGWWAPHLTSWWAPHGRASRTSWPRSDHPARRRLDRQSSAACAHARGPSPVRRRAVPRQGQQHERAEPPAVGLSQLLRLRAAVPRRAENPQPPLSEGSRHRSRNYPAGHGGQS